MSTLILLAWLSPLAQAASDAAPAGGGASMLIMMAMIFGILYFLMIRPQQKQDAERNKMVDELSKNDRVITNGGILGTVVSVKDDEIVLRVDDDKKVKMRFLKSAVMSLQAPKGAKQGNAK